jgi:hypothetical protein
MHSRSPMKHSDSYRSMKLLLKKSTASPKNAKILQTTVNPVTVTVKRDEHISPIAPAPTKFKKKLDVLKIRKRITEMTQHLSKNSWVNDPHTTRERMFKQEFPNKVYMLNRHTNQDPFSAMTRHLALDPNYLEQTGKLKTSTITHREFDLSLRPEKSHHRLSPLPPSPFPPSPLPLTKTHEFFNPGNEVTLLMALYQPKDIQDLVTLIRTKLFGVTAGLGVKERRMVFDSLAEGTGLGLGCGVLRGKPRGFLLDLMLVEQLVVEEGFGVYGAVLIDKG